jgi:GTP-binding protein
MLSTIALVGRPNVGKSTLFNRLTKSRDALVADFSGLTRDRKYGEVEFENRKFIVVDTGGISGDEFGIDNEMAEQSKLAIREADRVVFMLDCRDGLTPADEELASYIRKLGKDCLIVANKIDGLDQEVCLAPFYELGMGEVVGIAAAHGRGIRSLLEELTQDIPEQEEQEENSHGVKIAVVGRPNVGKSTLTNRMLGEDRVVVYDEPGTTRDSVYIPYERHGVPYTLIDTAGVRRRKNIKLPVEKFSIIKTLQAVNDANVVILVVDASEGIVDQDLHLLGSVIESGRALVIALNKWDGLDSDHKQFIKTELERRLRFIDFADIHFISALHGTGVGKLYESIERAHKAANEKFSTSYLTRLLEQAVDEHPPPLVRGRRIKLRYAHTGGHNPPIIVIHGNQTKEVPGHYTRYLEKLFRKALGLHGTPLKIEYRSGDNPYEGRKNKLTQRQVAKKKRLMRHVKKK